MAEAGAEGKAGRERVSLCPRLLVIGFACLGALQPLRGQTLPPDTIRADSIRPLPIPGIQVRILRTPLGLRESPLPVSVLGSEALTEGRSGASLEEALQALPGLQIQNRYNYSVGERIVLRGMGARTQFGVRGIRILVDGIPATLPDGQSNLDQVDLFSLGSVEILRGPGASLYGNGAAGVLRFRTRPPPSLPNRTELQLLGGGFGLRRASLLSAGTVGATGYLLSGGRLAFDGFRGDPVRGRGTYGKALRWTGNAQVSRPLGGGLLRVTMNLLSQESENPGSLSRNLLEEDPTQAYAFNVRQRTGEDASQEALGATWEGEWSGLEGEVGVYGVRRAVWNPIPPAIVDLSRDAGGIRGLLRGHGFPGWPGSTGTGVDWTVGVEMDGQWDRRRNLENEEGEAGAVILHQAERVLATGGFLQGRLWMEGRLDLLAGIRHDLVRFRVRDRLVGPGDPDDSGSRAMGAWSPSLGVRIHLAHGIDLRGSAASFFQTPTTSELANRPTGAGGFNPSLQPQRGRVLEVGMAAGAGRPLQVEGTFFHTRITDELVPFEVPEAAGRVFYRNAGRSRYRGVEVAAFSVFPGGVRVRGAYTWTDARFQEFSPDGQRMDGNRVPGVAPHRMDVVGNWRREAAGRVGGPFLEVRALYQGRVPVDDGNEHAAAPYTLLELRGGVDEVAVAGGRWSVFGGITNLLDRRYTTSVAVNAFGGRFFEPGPGRSLYLGVRTTLFPFGRGESTLTTR